jgi:hypothetical protein
MLENTALKIAEKKIHQFALQQKVLNESLRYIPKFIYFKG